VTYLLHTAVCVLAAVPLDRWQPACMSDLRRRQLGDICDRDEVRA
jgi:hypothetical protein